MNTYKLTLAYDGTAYHGWQIQPNGESVQEILQNVFQTILRHPVKVIGSGRTDAGVHASGQVAHFQSDQQLDQRKALYSLNGLLPKDIRVKAIELVSNDFHAQYSAKGKEYHYYLYLDSVMDPFKRFYCWHVHVQLDRDLLAQAAKQFVGTYNFSSFANQAHAGSAAVDPVRTIFRLDLVEIEGGLRLEFEGDGFLYKMVRNIVGTIIEVASKQRPLEDISLLLNVKDRRLAGAAAPPQGLFLVKVMY